MQKKAKQDNKLQPLGVSEELRNLVLGIRPGSPTRFSEEIASYICKSISSGQTLREIAAENGMPATSVIHEWIRTHPSFSSSYRLAREEFADYMAMKALEVAEDSTNDRKTDSKGRIIPNWENVNRSKLRVETYLKLAAKFAPHKYGDKLEINTTIEQVEQSPEERINKLHDIVNRQYNGNPFLLLEAMGFKQIEQNS
jgi:hypothetical protein